MEAQKQTVDVTPTWSELLPFMLQILKENSNEKAVAEIETEFKRMAQVADSYVAFVKATSKKIKNGSAK